MTSSEQLLELLLEVYHNPVKAFPESGFYCLVHFGDYPVQVIHGLLNILPFTGKELIPFLYNLILLNGSHIHFSKLSYAVPDLPVFLNSS